MNRAEAERCVQIAKKSLREGNREKATKFLKKAEKLHSLPEAQKLLESLEDEDNNVGSESTANGYGGAFFEHYQEPRARHGARFGGQASTDSEPSSSSASADHSAHKWNDVKKDRSRSRSAGRVPNGPSHPQMGVDYSKDELDSVKRINGSKDYYEILNLSKEFTETELKKSYRKMALLFHPDKCRAPGATEAFKAIGNAYAVLSDGKKRERYDMYGSEQVPTMSRRRHHYHEYDRGFDAEFTPEEIFNMFFGGGFPSGQVYRRQQRAGYQYYQTSTEEHRQEGTLGAALQLLPILILLFLSVASQFFIGEPAYNLHRNNKYPHERFTQDLRVPYYVKGDFMKSNKGIIRRIEQQVEEEFISNLRMSCYRERSQKETLAWRARTYGDQSMLEKAHSLTTPSCDKLNRIYA